MGIGDLGLAVEVGVLVVGDYAVGVTETKKLVPEGIAGRVPYKGTVQEVVYQLVGGLRSGMGYCGAASIMELHNAKFTRITNAGVAFTVT